MSAPGRLAVAVLGGTGPEGRGLALRFAAAGYPVVIGSRDAGRARETAERIAGRLAAVPGAVSPGAGDNLAAAARASIVVLAVPYAAQAETLTEVRPALEGKVLLSVVVPLAPPHVSTVDVPPGGSAAAEAQAAVGPGVRVVAAFHNVAASRLDDLSTDLGADVLVCGDDADAKARVLDLVAAAGATGYDAGPLCNAVVTEGLTAVLIGIGRRHKLRSPGVRIEAGQRIPAPRFTPDAPRADATGDGGPAADPGRAVAATSISVGEAGRATCVPVTLFPVTGLPLVMPGDDLGALVVDAVGRAGLALRDGDVLVVAQKVVSKAEDRLVDLRTVTPAKAAEELAAKVGKDARLVEVILSESRAVVRTAPGALIVETNLGFICANGGVDHSNVTGAEHTVALLPADPDASAERLRAHIRAATGADVAVIVNDSHGRAWREGAVGVAIGAAGIGALADLRGRPDLFGRALRVTTVGVIDELAAAASLVMGESDEGVPVVLVRGASYPRQATAARAIQRPRERDLFR